MVEEKKEDKKEKEGKDEKVEDVFLLQTGISLDSLKELADFFHGIQEFVQYLGTNQYYSDSVNKKVFLLNLDVDVCLLKLGKMLLSTSKHKDVLSKAICEKRKPTLDEKDLREFKKLLSETELDAFSVHERALALTEDIRKEYKQKQAV